MFTRIHGILLLLLLFFSNHANAVLLPKVDELKRLLAESPIEVEVVKPQLVEGKYRPHVVYLGYSVEKVLRAIFGNQWKTAAADIEFRALDGYVSRIPIERFDRYHAYLVFAKKNSSDFKVNSRHERDVSLAPYYLVWDNIRHPDLIKEGGTYWPYQVNEIMISLSSGKNMGPEKTSQRTLELEKYCLACHRVNGYGGNKAPLDLAERTKILGEEKFITWVLNPSSIKSDAGMPPIAEGMPKSDRQALARRLFEYLNNLPHK